MRVISGEYRSRRLLTLPGEKTRPTLDRVKEAVFSHLGTMENRCFLDLFCGSGAIGIEALSRGAKLVIFNDWDTEAIATTKKNLDNLKIAPAKYQIRQLDFRQLLKTIAMQFDFIYIDPPYDSGLFQEVLAQITQYRVLKPQGEIIVESEKNEELNDDELEITKTVKYGRVKINYLKNKKTI